MYVVVGGEAEVGACVCVFVSVHARLFDGRAVRMHHTQE